MTDTHDLGRFLETQARAYDHALAELRRGRKESHWMWYVFPQIAGLGSSPMSQRFAIGSAAEASAYLEHPVLGPRLRECAAVMNALPTSSAAEVLGAVDALKFRSSMTLFARVSEPDSEFVRALEKYFGGVPDPRTVALLDRGAAAGDEGAAATRRRDTR